MRSLPYFQRMMSGRGTDSNVADDERGADRLRSGIDAVREPPDVEQTADG